MGVMNDNIEKLRGREEKLEDLQNKTSRFISYSHLK
jgi:hypothetical protein